MSPTLSILTIFNFYDKLSIIGAPRNADQKPMALIVKAAQTLS
jgi:hypothetical protein